jgi:rubredoxin
MRPGKSKYIERHLLPKGAAHQSRCCPECSQPEVYWIAGFKGEQWYNMLHPDIEEHNYMCRACGYIWIDDTGGQPPG